jgi:predicted nucleotide-binding protein (sugar kinase/HSP70/actin superfamily)
MSGLEKNPGFKLSLSLGKKMLIGLLLGDLLMRVLYKTRPYEKAPGEANKLAHYWSVRISREMPHISIRKYRKFIREIVRDFDSVELTGEVKPKVGVVGEILVKYHPGANNDIVGTIEAEGGEAVVPDMCDFFLYGMHNKDFNYKQMSGTWKQLVIAKIGIAVIEWLRNPLRRALDASKRFEGPERIEKTAEKAQRIVSVGNQCGEGWLLTGEMVELIDSGVENIVCLQPFACLPNHVIGKGMMKALRKYEPLANIAAIDYDPGASDVNQFNRIKLMMATAKKNLRIKVETRKTVTPARESLPAAK